MCAGTVWAWGDGGFGKLGQANNDTLKVPKIVPELKGVAKVKCGAQFSVALTQDGNVYTWYVSVECAHQVQRLGITVTPSRVLLSFTASFHLRGSAEFHHLGHGDEDHVKVPKLVSRLAGEKIVDLAVGLQHTLALTESGNLYGWGKNSNGEVDGCGEAVSLPKLLPDSSKQGVMYIACGAYEVGVL